MSHKPRMLRISFYSLVIFMLPVQADRLPSSHLITFYIEQRAEPETKPVLPDTIKKVIKPENGTQSLIENVLIKHPVPGIYAAYLGWSTISDRNGQVILPRKHSEDRIQLVVTRSLQPVMSEELLIHHFVAGFDEPVAFYDFQFKEDPAHKKAEWTVKKIPTPPSRIIPIHAVVLIAVPDQIYVPEGTFPALKGGNLILPKIYARPNLTTDINALYFLRVNRYFAPVEYAMRYASTQYAKMVLS
jgi:hypothetical protein